MPEATTSQWLVITRKFFLAAAKHIKVDSTNNKLTDDSAHTVGSKRRMRVAEEKLGVDITKPPPTVIPTAVPKTKKVIAM